MNLDQNSVYSVGPDIGPGVRQRVLHTDPDGIYIINVDEDYPEAFPIHSSNIMLLRWEPAEDPWAELRATHDNDISPLNLSRRDRADQGLRHLRDLARTDAPAGSRPNRRLLDPTHRFRLIKAAAKQINTPTNTVRRWLNRWWVRGMNRNALLPDVIAMSGAGTIRAVPAEECDSLGNPLDPNLHKKPGRRSGNGTRRGIKMTAPIRASIETLGRNLYFDHGLNSVPDTYDLWKKERKAIAPHRYPTPQVFYDVLVKVAGVRAEIKRRGLAGRKPRGGAAESDAMHTRVPGPGFCFQGDSTPLPRVRVDGKIVTLYFASDTFTSAITGYYAYVGKPSADAHSRCLAHAAIDKPSYCCLHKIPVTKEQWPMAVVPEAWVADRGELIGPIADYLVSSFDIVLQNTPAYSPQLKADVESAFGAMLRNLISKLDDHVTPRPGRKFGPTIKLTMDDLHALLILFILAHNSRKIPQIPTPSQMARGVAMTPLGLWNREVDRMNGEGRKFSADELLLVTTKRADAKLDETGLCFEGLTYDCTESGVSAFQSDLGGRGKKATIHYDEGATDRIFIQRKVLHRLGVVTVGPQHEFIHCVLSQRDARWAGYTFPDYREAYRIHTEVTQNLYDVADAAKAAAAEGIANKNAGNPVVPEAGTPDVKVVERPAAVPVVAISPSSTLPQNSTPDPATANADEQISGSGPGEVGISAGLRRSRRKRSNISP